MSNQSVAEFLKTHHKPTFHTFQLKESNSTLQDVNKASGLIHKNSLVGPANLIFVNSPKTIESHFVLKTIKQSNEVPSFSDATFLGTIDNIYFVYESKAILEGMLMVALLSTGVDFKPRPRIEGKMPEIDVEVDLVHPKGFLKYFGFIELKFEEDEYDYTSPNSFALEKMMKENPNMYKTDDINWVNPNIECGNQIPIKIKLVDLNAKIPSYQTPGSAGMDITSIEETELAPGERKLIQTGISIQLPKGYEAQVRPRSGLALKQGITCLNSPGTIDSDYRGTVGAILINHSNETFKIKVGDRIAQMVIAKVEQARFFEVETLDSTERGTGGYGSTGTK